MAKDLIEKSLRDRFDHVYWSIYLCNSSLTELHIISDIPYNKNELSVVNSHPFNFYRVTLQYCIIMEYNKLLEKGRKDKDQNISSLFQLNEVIYSTRGKSFETIHLDNERKLLNIKATDFYENVRKLRDKKFAHADNHEINIPFKIKGFQTKDFEEGFLHLQTIKEVLNNCTTIYGFEYDLQSLFNDNRTENFIRFQAKYQEYYFNNLMKVRSEKFNHRSDKE